MYPGELGKKYADRPAFIMASTGKEVTYAEFESLKYRCGFVKISQLRFERGLRVLGLRHQFEV